MRFASYWQTRFGGADVAAMILGLDRLLTKLASMAMPPGPVTFVGLTQTYALHVHEFKRPHKEPTQWKFLEEPARTKQNEIAEEVRNTYMMLPASPRRLEKSLLVGCLRLQAEAQLITPVQTGALRASAFTCVEKELEQKSAEALARSEAKRGAG